MRAPALLLVCVLLLAACSDGGGSGDASPSSTTGATTTAARPTTTLAPVPGPFAPGRTPIPGFGEVEVRIVDGPDGEPLVLCVLLAETPEQRARGLMEVADPDLGGYDGMLFTFDEDQEGGFYMKDTVLPLSIAYLGADGTTVDALDMEPCPAGNPGLPHLPLGRAVPPHPGGAPGGPRPPRPRRSGPRPAWRSGGACAPAEP